jgi:hypothetical protein
MADETSPDASLGACAEYAMEAWTVRSSQAAEQVNNDRDAEQRNDQV